LVARGRQLVMNRQAHIVSLEFMVQRPGQRVTHELPLAAPPPPRRSWFRAEPSARRQSVWMLLTGRSIGLMLVCRLI
jgi:hypothetical protein